TLSPSDRLAIASHAGEACAHLKCVFRGRAVAPLLCAHSATSAIGHPGTSKTKTQIPRPRASCVLALLGTLVCARTAAADTLTLQWDLNSEPEVTGYLVYIGTQPGVYSQTVDVQNVDTYQFTDAAPGQEYCFAVAAYAGSLVSPLSAEVCGVSNDYPNLANPGDQAGRVGQSASLQLSGSDPEGAPVSYSA